MTSATIRTLAFLIGTIGITACSTNQGAPGPATGVCSDEPEPRAEVAEEPVALADEPPAECGVAGAATAER